MSIHMQTTILRPFNYHDALACLAVFESNVPHFFGSNEADEFKRFLSQPDCEVIVATIEGRVSGCGGYYRRGSEGALCWEMVHADLHGMGIGRALLDERLVRLFDDPTVTVVAINTSQHARAFFERYGFSVDGEVISNGFAAGIDQVRMLLARTAWNGSQP